MMMQAIDLNPGDLFLESSDTGYVWQAGTIDDDGDLIARRVMVRMRSPKQGGYGWRLNVQGNECMNPCANVDLVNIVPM